MTLKQKAFVKALTDPRSETYCKPSASYRKASPAVKDNSSWVESHRMLRKPNVRQMVIGQLGIDDLGNNLKRYLSEAESVMFDTGEPAIKLAAARVCTDINMDYGKLTGQIKDKVEVSTDADTSAVRDMVAASMKQNASAS